MTLEPVSLSAEMKESYLSYSMSVIVGRALPDLYDGLKPVHRRILYAMHGLGLSPEGKYMKAARVEGETMGKYHPHGSAYGSMVTLAAPYSNNHCLIDGHGNWGSPTDGAAASRYTECRLSAYAEDILLSQVDLCEMKDNYDGSLKEPVRFLSRLPNILIQGSEGIGVGYATSIPQHSLRGVVKAILDELEGLPCDPSHLTPDFPSGCNIIQDAGLEEYLSSGRGSIRMRASVEEEVVVRSGRKANWKQLVFTNLPYQADTESVSEEIRSAVEKGLIEGIVEVRDESDRTGDRLVVVYKEEDVLPYLWKYTKLEKVFSANTVVIENLAPVSVSPRDIISKWVVWRDSTLVLQFIAEAEKLAKRIEVVSGLLLVPKNLDRVLQIIRASDNKDKAAKALESEFKLTPNQSNAILQMRLHQLTGLDLKTLGQEEKKLKSQLALANSRIKSKQKRNQFLREELEELAKRHGNARKSKLIKGISPEEKKEEKPAVTKTRFLKVNQAKGTVEQLKGARGANLIIPGGDKLIVLSEEGWVKRLPPTAKGALFDKPTKLVLAQRQEKVSSETFLCVWDYQGSVFAATIKGDDLRKTTSTGKRWLREGATLLYFGTGKWKTLTIGTVPLKPLASKGVKQRLLKDLV